MDKPVIIFGAAGVGKMALEIFQSNGVVVYGFLDADKTRHSQEIDSIPILGDPEDHGFLKLIGKKCEAFVATDDNKIRKNQVEMLMEERKVMPTNAVHKSASISGSVAIGHGNFIAAGVHVGPDTKIGQHCMLNTAVVVEQDCEVGDFVQIGAGSIINGGVKIGKNVFVGSGVVVVAGAEIGANARIGAGSVVVGNVEKGKTVFGNPAVNIEK